MLRTGEADLLVEARRRAAAAQKSGARCRVGFRVQGLGLLCFPGGSMFLNLYLNWVRVSVEFACIGLFGAPGFVSY